MPVISNEPALTVSDTVRVPTWVSDTLIMATVIIATAVPAAPPPSPMGRPDMEAPIAATWAVYAVAVVAASTLLLRRRFPCAVFVTTLGIYTTVAWLGMPSLGPGIAVSVSAFSMANRVSRRQAFIAGGIGAVTIGAMSLIASEQWVFEPQIFQFAAFVAIATTLGESARSRRFYIAAVTERAERAEETREAEAARRVTEERLRIAQDLHDTVAHRISVISLNAGVASAALEVNPAKAKDALGKIRIASREVLGDIGTLLHYLREQDNADHAPLPQPTLSEVPELIHSMEGAGLHTEFTSRGDLDQVAGTPGAVAYRVVQEGLTNAHKHGSGRSAKVLLDLLSDEIMVHIENPISPDDRNQPDAPSGKMGITGLRERVAAIGGSVRIEKTADKYVLQANIPNTLEISS